MAAKRDLSKKSVDELDKMMVANKKARAALKDEAQAIHDVRTLKVNADRERDARDAVGKPGVVVGMPGPGGETGETRKVGRQN